MWEVEMRECRIYSNGSKELDTKLDIPGYGGTMKVEVFSLFFVYVLFFSKLEIPGKVTLWEGA